MVQWGWLEMVRPDHAERWPASLPLLEVDAFLREVAGARREGR